MDADFDELLQQVKTFRSLITLIGIVSIFTYIVIGVIVARTPAPTIPVVIAKYLRIGLYIAAVLDLFIGSFIIYRITARERVVAKFQIEWADV